MPINTLPESVLACIDGSAVTQSICDYAAWYAHHLDCPVTLLHVINVPKSDRYDLSGAIGMDSRTHLMRELAILDEQTARLANKHGDALLQDAKTHIKELYPNLSIYTQLRHSKLLPALDYFASKSRLIVLGRRGQDHSDGIAIGSQIENTVRARHQPILICSEAFKNPTTYMLAFDGRETAQNAVKMICKYPKLSQGLTGYLVMVDTCNVQAKKALDDALIQMQQAGLTVTAHLIDAHAYDSDSQYGRQDGDVVTTLFAFQHKYDIDMIVIGAYGHSKLRQLFIGSNTTKILSQTTLPVLLLR